ncbi:MAG: hypothetical protein ACK4UP_13435 [Spirosomataceae bacterium]
MILQSGSVGKQERIDEASYSVCWLRAEWKVKFVQKEAMPDVSG